MRPFQFVHEELQPGIDRYRLMSTTQPMSFAELFERWEHDPEFVEGFGRILGQSRFTAFRWELPGLTRSRLLLPAEFVLIDAPSLARKADRQTYAEHFANSRDGLTAVFPSLGQDAKLVVPCPFDETAQYDQLARFLRTAPLHQQIALWRMVAVTMRMELGDESSQGGNSEESRDEAEPERWLNTEGGGVAWLHVRIDQRPKYYHYAPYKTKQNRPGR